MKKFLFYFVATLLFVQQIALVFDFVYNDIAYDFKDDIVSDSASCNIGISNAVLISDTVGFSPKTYPIAVIKRSQLITLIENPNNIISI